VAKPTLGERQVAAELLGLASDQGLLRQGWSSPPTKAWPAALGEQLGGAFPARLPGGPLLRGAGSCLLLAAVVGHPGMLLHHRLAITLRRKDQQEGSPVPVTGTAGIRRPLSCTASALSSWKGEPLHKGGSGHEGDIGTPLGGTMGEAVLEGLAGGDG
jgi:hypothetical protein